ncbi:hypothetical protein [Nocardioides sp. InS609-2]|uniref:hypothetical protein n=1 Tax=Nocardioides sp. InS609-2 TaxID=2760705 RepID=UPI0020C12909|nr:hypothetical protein [Nocardioides sp. InS609-2]
MRRTVVVLIASAVAALLTGPSGAALPEHGRSAPLAGSSCEVFPADNYWHADIRDLPTHALSDQWLAHLSSGSDLHPDFGSSYGIPITVVGGGHKRVKVKFLYAGESDRVRYPLGKDTRIEGGRSSDGDRHAIVVNRKTCRLYETYATEKRGGKWLAGSGATWSLRSDSLRPDGWTSSDAAGLPILPGLLRWDEVRERRVDHAIRFTTDKTSRWHLWPARHDAGSESSHDYPPMGARFRLDADFSTAGYGADAAEVIRAMQTYGLVLADNGSPWFFQGEQNRRWPNRLVEDLKQIPASAFVAVDTAPLKVSTDSAAVW